MKKVIRIIAISLVMIIVLGLTTVVFAETDSVGTVTADSLYVRTNPGVSNSAIGTVHRNFTFTVTETKVVNGTVWYKIPFSNGRYGWVSGKYVSTSASLTPVTTPDKTYDSVKNMVVTGDTVNVRTGPSTAYTKICRVQKGNTVKAVGESVTGSTIWYCIDLGSGSRGWISGKYVAQTTNGGGTVTPEEPAGSGEYIIVTGGTVNVRTGAGTSYRRVGYAHKYDIYKLLGKAKASNGTTWYKISYGGAEGWISSAYSSVIDAEKAIEAINNVITPGSNGTLLVTGSTVNVRKGPGTDYSKLGQVNCGKMLSYEKYSVVNGIIWYNVNYNGQSGWICGTYATPVTTPDSQPAESDADEAEDETPEQPENPVASDSDVPPAEDVTSGSDA